MGIIHFVLSHRRDPSEHLSNGHAYQVAIQEAATLDDGLPVLRDIASMWLRIELCSELARPASARRTRVFLRLCAVHPGPIDSYPAPFSSFPPPIPSERKNLTNPFLHVVGRTSIILTSTVLPSNPSRSSILWPITPKLLE